jgi:hypothetical protein
MCTLENRTESRTWTPGKEIDINLLRRPFLEELWSQICRHRMILKERLERRFGRSVGNFRGLGQLWRSFSQGNHPGPRRLRPGQENIVRLDPRNPLFDSMKYRPANMAPGLKASSPGAQCLLRINCNYVSSEISNGYK